MTASRWSFYDAYNAFLGAIQLTGGDPAMEQLAEDFRATREQAQGELNTDTNAAMTAYGVYKNAATSAGITPQTECGLV